MTVADYREFEVQGMTLDQYQQQSATTAVYKGRGEWQGLAYTVLGACGEVGECANDVKKMNRDDNTNRKPARVSKVIDELGDAMWYIAQTCTELGISLQLVIEMNREKLLDRQRRDVLHGDGHTR